MNWSSRPMVRLFILLVAGIFLASWIPYLKEVNLLWYLVSLALSSLVAYVVYRKNRSWKWRWINGLMFSLLIMLTGIYLTISKFSGAPAGWLDQEKTFVAEVVDEPVQTENSVKMILRLRPATSGDAPGENRQRVMAFFEKDSLSRKLQYGDLLVLKGKLTPPEKPKNPGEFGYATFLAFHNIYATVFVSKNKWTLLGSEGNPLFIAAIKIRNYLLNALQQNGVKGNEYTVAAAILLGYDQLMAPDLEQQYTTAGAMHVLCVSGLHVGIIYLVLDFLLGFLRKNKTQKFIKVILLLFLIWFYALLTGLSPSVMRASIMISLFIIASLFSRYNDVYNTLAASAVLLLLFHPFLIFNVGFQLSYSAVLGILVFYQPLYQMIYVKSTIADKIWAILAVSIAAQLGTFPLAAHYFHFFPTYFWLTNIFIFPLSFAIIGGGMAFMIFSWVPVMSHILGVILSGFVFMLNYLIGLVQDLPFNGINDLYFPWIKVALVYVLIFMLLFLFLGRRVKLALPTLSVILLLLLFNTWHKYQVLRQKRIVVYSLRGHSAYDYIRGKDHLMIVDSSLLAQEQKVAYHLQNCRIGWGLQKNYLQAGKVVENSHLQLYYNGCFGMFGPYKFMVLNGKKYYKTNQTVQLDFVIVSGEKILDLHQLRQIVGFDSLILDSSVPYWKQKKLEKQAKELKIKCYNVSKQGAYILEM